MTRAQADLLLLFAAVIWGVAFYFQKTAMAAVGPLLFLACRSIVASLTLWPVAMREGRSAAGGIVEPKRFARVVVAGGVLFFVAAALQQFGLVTATVTNSGFLTGLYVVITPLLVWIWWRRRPGPVVIAAALLAFAGMWMLGGGTIGGFSTGDYLVATCALFWSIHLIVTGAASRHARPVLFTCLQFAVVGALALAGALAFETISLDGLRQAWLEILFVGVLSSALTFTILAVAMKHTPAPEAAVLVSMETLFAAIAGAILLGERLTPLGWAGAGLMFAASLLVPLAPLVEARLRLRSGRT